MTFITAQRERLSILLTALDKEAAQLNGEESRQNAGAGNLPGMFFDGTAEEQSRSVSSMSKSRSEADFEKIEREESGEEGAVRPPVPVQRSGSWLPWSWGAKTPAAIPQQQPKDIDTSIGGVELEHGKSTGVEL